MFFAALFLLQANTVAPVHLNVPRIFVDAPIESLGIVSEGTPQTTKSPSTVAWFDKSPRPGEEGNSVISGHFGWKNEIPAVFDNLKDMRVGDVVYVTDSAGLTAIFSVREVRVYGEFDNAAEVFVSNDGKAHLNLVTCEGTWNKARQSYSNRRVVFTDALTF